MPEEEEETKKCPCTMPLTEETRCSCKPELCAICCECPPDCPCGCQQKAAKIKGHP